MADFKQPTIYESMIGLGGGILAAVDLETTGLKPYYHEVIQVAVVPLDTELQQRQDIKPFYQYICPQHWERAQAGAFATNKVPRGVLEASPNAERIADELRKWFDGLNMPLGMRLTPLAHNWAFESAFLTAWLGQEEKEAIFDSRARDTMTFGAGLCDRYEMKGEPRPFDKLNLATLCRKLKVTNQTPHNALSDALAEAECYQRLLRMDWL